MINPDQRVECHVFDPQTLEPPKEHRESKCFSTLKSWAHQASNSKALMIALMITGILGIGVMGVGLTSFFSHMHMLPTQLATLNTLGAISNNLVIAMVVVGNAMMAAGILGIFLLVRKRHNDQKQKVEAALKRNEESSHLEQLRHKEQIKLEKTAADKAIFLEREKQRLANIEKLPEELRPYAHKLSATSFIILEEPSIFKKTYTILYRTDLEYRYEAKIPEAALADTCRDYMKSFTYTV